MTQKTNLVADAIVGLAVGDAFGLPYHFMNRDSIKLKSNNVMKTSNIVEEPLGSFSDDTSLTLCLLDSLTRYKKINYSDICNNFVLWLGSGKFTPLGHAFGVGQTTLKAIQNFAKRMTPIECGSKDEFSNGNGSLIRILPLAFHLYKRYGACLFINPKCVKTIAETSSLTHAHERTIIAVSIYLSIAVKTLDKRFKLGKPLAKSQLNKAIEEGTQEALDYFLTRKEFKGQLGYFSKFLINEKTQKLNLLAFGDKEIRSSAYVVDTLESAIWCLLKSKTYKQTVVLAVNLGGDTDSCASVSGGLAGLAYGKEAIPASWKASLLGSTQINKLCVKYMKQLSLI